MTEEGANELGIQQTHPQYHFKKWIEKNNEHIVMRVLQKKKKSSTLEKIPSNKTAWSTRNPGDNNLGGINILKQEFWDMKSHFESKIE